MNTAVLLPLRLETRFDDSRLRVRVIPDEPWFDRHDPLPSAAELAGLDRYLAAAGDDPATPEAVQAWRLFATQHGPGRAAWLVRTFRTAERPALLREDIRFTELAGFPAELQVWIARAGGEPELAATMTVKPERLRMDLPDPDLPDDRRWWDSWDVAVCAGLATEIDLGPSGADIVALYVVGLATTSPATLFGRHRDAGRLGLLAPGAPTNSVDGKPAADLGQDPTAWLALLGRGTTTVERQISLALTGERELLGPLPGPTQPHQRWARELLTGLFPALVGHALTDVLGLGRLTGTAAAWAENNVDPIGPFPALRIGGQPYGILPVTSLAQWVPDERDSPLQTALIKPLATLRSRWARAAVRAGRGAIEGATAEHLLDLLAQPPASPGYALRPMQPMELWHLALLATGHPNRWPNFVGEWRRANPVADELRLRPGRRYGSRGWTRRLRLPLITPRGLPAGETAGTILRRLTDLADERPSVFATTAGIEEAVGAPMNSLLLRLAIRSLQVALGNLGRGRLGVPPGALEPVAVRPDVPPALSRWIRAADLAVAATEPDPGHVADLRRVTEALRTLSGVPAADLERLLPYAVDCATHRIDPWVTAVARQRQRRLAAATPVLGAYGWVDRPQPGQPGPTEGGLLHAPSPPQALTAALIRDRAINDPQAGRWHMDITSSRARLAARIAGEVRAGAHPAEALGREVERVVADPLRIRALRRAFRLRAEHEGRRTCDGLRVLAADPATLGLPDDVLAELAPLRESVDVYADLLVAEAVHHVVEGRTGSAGAALDAAAGLARPPVLDVLRTRREGRPVETRCLVVIPDAAPEPLPADPAALAEVRPARFADPAVAAFLVAQVGEADNWRWRVRRPDGSTATVTLADTGLEPAEALALPLGALERLVLGDAPEFENRTGSLRYERAVRLVGLLGRTPATPADAAETTAGPSGPGGAAELRDRLAGLRSVAEALSDRLRDTSGEADRRAALALTARWGVLPEPATDDLEPLAGQMRAARAQLLDRLTAAPDMAAAASLDELRLAAAIAALASPTGHLAVLGRLRRDQLPSLDRVDLDREWLSQVAPVRPPLARLEAYQLAADTVAAAGRALDPWTNRPDDPWQTDPEDSRRLVVTYAADNLDLAGSAPARVLAAGLLDRFAETVPNDEHTTSAAFGFDAPGARAPQAILLAVSPDPAHDLDPPTLVHIVAETRELTRARMATLSDLDGLSGLLPLPVVPATGDTAIRLEG